ncbi:acetamidase/formamidase family protein [Bacillus fonticola]|uniref:acetamidase/formamidase family protein n=1 Tax=Bacillus fonticola TaxID=2728853 RepID=UPI001475CD7D|nr:acetamidase/formamidase family protein [Bacillus fonticola]
MKTLQKGKPFYAFSKENEAKVHVRTGERVAIETYDCFEDQIQSESTTMQQLDWDRVNPATGPVYVEGAEQGDVLAVTIHSIDIGAQGVMVTGPDLGVMGHRVDSFSVKVLPIEGDKVTFSTSLQFPVQKMIGVIGVAPEGEPVNNGTPGAHGGNLDTTLMTEGATVYFPVFTEGALFGLGDFHAAMGDGEIGVSGVEVPGKVEVTLDVVKEQPIRYPFLQNDEGLAILVSKHTLDEAVKVAVEEMIDFLHPHTDLSLAELTMAMSAVGHTQISQVVDPLVTCRFFVPSSFLEAFNCTPFAQNKN